MTFILLSMKSEIDVSVLCTISDVFVAVEVCNTANQTQDYSANKILPDLKYTKQRSLMQNTSKPGGSPIA